MRRSFAFLALFISGAAWAETHTFRERTRLPDKAFSVYVAREDGSAVRVEITTTALVALGRKGSPQPPRPPSLPPGKTWDLRFSAPFLQVNSASGFLEPGDGVLLADGRWMICYRSDGKLGDVNPARGFVISGTGNTRTVTPDPDAFTLLNGVVESRDSFSLQMEGRR